MAVRPRGPRLLRCGGPSMWCGRGAGSSNCPDRGILTSRVSPDETMTRSGNRPDPNKSPRTGGRLDSRTLPFTSTRDARIGRMIAGHQETFKQYAPTIAQDGPRCSRECNAPTLPTTSTTLAMKRFYKGWRLRYDYRPGRHPTAVRADRLGVVLSARTIDELVGMIDTRQRNTRQRTQGKR